MTLFIAIQVFVLEVRGYRGRGKEDLLANEARSETLALYSYSGYHKHLLSFSNATCQPRLQLRHGTSCQPQPVLL